MKRLRIDLYTGLADDQTHTFRDSWIQLAGESIEELAERIKQVAIENLESIQESEDNQSDTDDYV